MQLAVGGYCTDDRGLRAIRQGEGEGLEGFYTVEEISSANFHSDTLRQANYRVETSQHPNHTHRFACPTIFATIFGLDSGSAEME